jgi:hypothetical protein
MDNIQNWDKTPKPVICGRCGKILNGSTPYSVYFHADSTIQVCAECFHKENEIRFVETKTIGSED